MLGKRAMSFSGAEEVSGEGDLSDDCSHGGERKRRLNVEQVKTLEKNFEMGNKLEPERKMQLARALGLQPRQIAIWFQNRRARWKTKQLEKDFDLLKRQFDAVKAENDALHSLNKKLLTEVSLSLSRSIPITDAIIFISFVNSLLPKANGIGYLFLSLSLSFSFPIMNGAELILFLNYPIPKENGIWSPFPLSSLYKC